MRRHLAESNTAHLTGNMSTNMAEPEYAHRLRVYWEDTDAGGIVFYANYLKFFERARTEWLRSLGFSQQAMATDAADGAIFVVTDTQLSYRQPARLDDELTVTVHLSRRGAASLVIRQQALRLDGDTTTLLAEGEIRIGCVSPGTLKPRRIPTAILHRLSP